MSRLISFELENDQYKCFVQFSVGAGKQTSEAIYVSVAEEDMKVRCSCGFDAHVAGLIFTAVQLGTAITGRLRKDKKVVGEFVLKKDASGLSMSIAQVDRPFLCIRLESEDERDLEALFASIGESHE